MNELDLIARIFPILIPLLGGRFIVWGKLLHPRDAKILSVLFLYVCTPPLIVGLIPPEDIKTLLDLRFILASLYIKYQAAHSYGICTLLWPGVIHAT